MSEVTAADIQGRLPPGCRWTVLGFAGSRGSHRFWLCRCSCEKQTEKQIDQGNLIRGHSQSCGCLRREKTVAWNEFAKKCRERRIDPTSEEAERLKRGEESHAETRSHGENEAA
jgi:hypothetical protein